MTLGSIPSHWGTATLDQVLEMLPSGSTVQQGWSPQCEKEAAGPGEWGVLKTTAIQPGAFHDEYNKRLPGHFQPRSSIEVMPGDLLLTNAGPRARCAIPCLVRMTRPRLMLSGKFYRFRANESLMDPRFLESFLLAPATQQLLDRMKTGISDSGLNLTRAKFLALPVVVPPLEEQRRIVDLLEDHLSRLDVGTTLIRRTTGASQLLRTQLVEVELAALDISDQTVADVAVLVTDGDHNPPKRVPAGVPHVTAKGIRDGLISFEAGTFVSEEGYLQTSSRYEPTTGDVIVTCVGTIGRVAVVPEGLRFSADRNLAAIRLDGTKVLPDFLELWLQTPRIQAYMAAASGSTAQPHLYLRDLRRLPIRVPCLTDQRRVLDRVAERSAPVDASLRLANRVLGYVPALRRSLLAAAFSGQLTSDFAISEGLHV